MDKLVRKFVVAGFRFRYHSAIALIAIFITALAPCASGANYQFQPVYRVSGTTKIQGLRDAKVFLNATNRFVLLGDAEGRWKLERHADLMKQWGLTSPEKISYDGTNLYNLVASRSTDAFAGRVASGPFPLDYGPDVGIIWLAFFGGAKLDPRSTVTNWPDLTIVTPRSDPMAWMCDLHYKLLAGRSPLITEATYVADGTRLSENPQDYPLAVDMPSDEEADLRFRALVNLARTCIVASPVRARITVSNVTNVNGINIPLSIHCIRTTTTNLSFTYVIAVTNLDFPAQESLLPELDRPADIVDTRVRSRAPRSEVWLDRASYRIGPNGWILNTNDDVIRAAGRLRAGPFYMPKARNGSQIY